ncbi:MAG: hypothetical protein QM684_13980 [Rhizobium sp.]
MAIGPLPAVGRCKCASTTRISATCYHILGQLPQEYGIDDPQGLPFRIRTANEALVSSKSREYGKVTALRFAEEDSPKQA